MDTLALGLWGEREAARYLKARGLAVLEHHYRQKWGEIDLVCKDRDTWVFVEVKTRSKLYEPGALGAIGQAKRQKLARTAMSYMKSQRIEGQAMRFDVVVIEDGEMEWIQNAFELPSRYTC